MRKRNGVFLVCVIIMALMPIACFAGMSISQNDYINKYNQSIAGYGFEDQATIMSPLDDANTYYLAKNNTILSRSHKEESYSFAICIDETTDKVVAVQVLFDDEFLLATSTKEKQLISSICKAMIDGFCEVSKDKQEAIIKKVLLNNGGLNIDVQFYDNGFVFQSGYESNSPIRSGTSFSITAVDQDDFNSGLYWTPYNSLEYFIQAGDIAMAEQEYDSAVMYYEQTRDVWDKLEQAYRAKADNLRSQGDIEGANDVLAYAGLDGAVDQAVNNGSEYLLQKEIHYDENGEISSIREHTYDDQARKICTADTSYYSKSAADQLKKYGISADPFGFSVTYEYNNIGQVIIERVHGENINGDAMGGYYALGYDELGNETLRQEYDETGAIKSYTKYSYDIFRNTVKESRYWGSSTVPRLTIYEYDYDTAGKKTACKETDYVYVDGVSTSGGSNVSKYTYEQDSNSMSETCTIYRSDGSISYMNVLEFDSYGNESKLTQYYSRSTRDKLELSSWVDYEYISIEDAKNASTQSVDLVEFYADSSTDSQSIAGEWKAVNWLDYTTMDEKGIDPYQRIPNEYLLPMTGNIRLIIKDNSLETINSIGVSKISEWEWFDNKTIIRKNVSVQDEEDSFTVINSDIIHSGGGDGVLVYQRIPVSP